MKEFEVTITETLERVVTVEAESRDEAMQMVEDMWKSSEIILTDSDFTDVDYDANDGIEIEKPNTLDVLLVKPGQYAFFSTFRFAKSHASRVRASSRCQITTIDAGLSSMQELVGGYIEAISPFNEPVVLICNEEGKINGSELNRALKDENGNVLEIIAGTFFICGTGDENFVSLPPEHREKFEKMFKKPEAFLKMGKGIMAIPVEPKKSEPNKQTDAKSKGHEL